MEQIFRQGAIVMGICFCQPQIPCCRNAIPSCNRSAAIALHLVGGLVRDACLVFLSCTCVHSLGKRLAHSARWKEAPLVSGTHDLQCG